MLLLYHDIQLLRYFGGEEVEQTRAVAREIECHPPTHIDMAVRDGRGAAHGRRCSWIAARITSDSVKKCANSKSGASGGVVRLKRFPRAGAI